MGRDDVRLSEIEPRFIRQACGRKGADVRPTAAIHREETDDAVARFYVSPPPNGNLGLRPKPPTTTPGGAYFVCGLPSAGSSGRPHKLASVSQAGDLLPFVTAPALEQNRFTPNGMKVHPPAKRWGPNTGNIRASRMLQCGTRSFVMSDTKESEEPKESAEPKPKKPSTPKTPGAGPGVSRDGLESPRSYHC
jgi:hypothetical protein